MPRRRIVAHQPGHILSSFLRYATFLRKNVAYPSNQLSTKQRLKIVVGCKPKHDLSACHRSAWQAKKGAVLLILVTIPSIVLRLQYILAATSFWVSPCCASARRTSASCRRRQPTINCLRRSNSSWYEAGTIMIHLHKKQFLRSAARFPVQPPCADSPTG